MAKKQKISIQKIVDRKIISKRENTNMSMKDIAEKTKRELVELTSFKSPSLVGARKEGSGWMFSIEVVEKNSVPDGMDVLGLYEVKADAEGGVVEYARKSTRRRVDSVGAETVEE